MVKYIKSLLNKLLGRKPSQEGLVYTVPEDIKYLSISVSGGGGGGGSAVPEVVEEKILPFKELLGVGEMTKENNSGVSRLPAGKPGDVLKYNKKKDQWYWASAPKKSKKKAKKSKRKSK